MTAFMARPDRNISWCKFTEKWKVRITRNGCEHFLGRFDTKEAARAVRDAFDDPRKLALEARARRVAQQGAIAKGIPFVNSRPEISADHRAAQVEWQVYLDNPLRAELQASFDDLLYSHLQTMVRCGIPIESVCEVAGIETKALEALTRRVLAVRNAAV